MVWFAFCRCTLVGVEIVNLRLLHMIDHATGNPMGCAVQLALEFGFVF